MSKAQAAKMFIAPDTVLAMLGGTLVVVGLVAISSASIEYADLNYQNPWFHTQRHLVYLLLALSGAVLVYRVPTRFWLDTGWVWLLVLLQASGGLLVASVMKYADNVLKGLATGVSVVVSTVLSMIIFGTPLTTPFVIGAIMILTSVHGFSLGAS